MKNLYTCFFLLVLTRGFAQIPTGAIGYWPFDNNAQDMSGNGNHGTATNAIPYFDRFGNPNKAYRFNGSSSKVVVPHSAGIDVGPNENLTIAIWEKAYNNSPSTIFAKHVSGNWNGYTMIAGNTADPGYCTTLNHIFFYTASGYQQDACSNSDLLKDSTWHFLLGTYNAATQINNFYVDGVLQTDVGGSAGAMTNTASLSFGNDAGTNTGFFNGVLDGARIYKRILTQSEILALYNEPNPGTTGILPANKTALNIEVTPNPGSGIFNINFSDPASEHIIEIYSSLGQLLLSKTPVSENTLIDLQNNSPGLYYLVVKGPSDYSTMKIIKE